MNTGGRALQSFSLPDRLLVGLFILLFTRFSYAYPIDAYDDTGIRRLDYYHAAQTGEIQGKKLFEGAMLNSADVVPRLLGQTSELPPVNKDISRQLARLIPSEPNRYSIAVLDLSDPSNPIYALSLIHI